VDASKAGILDPLLFAVFTAQQRVGGVCAILGHLDQFGLAASADIYANLFVREFDAVPDESVWGHKCATKAGFDSDG
jgi:hypothetical protein